MLRYDKKLDRVLVMVLSGNSNNVLLIILASINS